MNEFLEALRIQRWDDHRYYHHSRVNQSLHLVSALSFIASYVLLLSDPASAALLAWMVSMTSRQAGHFFFEPKGYDLANQATHERKEDIKVGYNLRRKVVLMAIWALSPLFLLADTSAFGMLEPVTTMPRFMHNLGAVWLTIGIGGLAFRTLHLFLLSDVKTGLTWFAKIITDPFHDVMLYWRSPLYLVRGELIDPNHARHTP
ncbi:MAG: hypothetical protein ABI645_04155 [Pseudomonadota bacterium]